MLQDDTITIAALEADPYPHFARLRAMGDVVHVPAARVAFATGWNAVDTICRSPAIWTAEAPGAPVATAFGTPAILTTDGPAHADLRGGIEPGYRPRAVQALEGMIDTIVADHIAALRGRPQADLIADYFEPVSALCLARSFGFRDVDAPTLRRWFHGLSQGAINYEGDPARAAISDATCAEIEGVARPLLARLAHSPDGSPLSHMLHHSRDGTSPRDPDTLLPTIKITLLGGMQEPGHGAATTLVGLLSDPAQIAAVRADPALIPQGVDEGIRWVAPIGTAFRIARADTVIGTTDIPAGTAVAAVLSAANRDPARFADPDRFDLFRAAGPGLGFATGPHFCAGKWFARAQMTRMLAALLDAFPNLHLAAPPRFFGWEFRAPAALQVNLT
jgi:cytochrome P450